MALRSVRIDERTWEDATRERRGEWRASIEGLLAAGDNLSFPEGTERLEVAVSGQTTTWSLRGADEALIATATVRKSAMAKYVSEYVDIVRQIDRSEEGFGSTRLEALDMAKKLTHDEAATALVQILTPLAADHHTCRLIFTLLFSLRVDTTRLTGVRGHRPIR